MAQPNYHGLFIWQELLTSDTAKAQDFYRQIMGWQAQPWKDSDYVLLSASQGAVGGLMRLPDELRHMGAKPHWLPYIGAADADATVAQAQRLGARILKPPTAIEEVGRYAVLADPQGASFGVFTPKSSEGRRQGMPRVGEFAWFELATSDPDGAFDFYSELFGWQVRRRHDMGAMGIYQVYGFGDVAKGKGMDMGGIYKLGGPNQGRAPYWLSYVSVADADTTAQAARDSGGSVVHGPSDVPGGGRIAQVLDPQGVLFAVFAAPRAAAAPGSGAGKSTGEPAGVKATGQPNATGPTRKPAARGKVPASASKPRGKAAGKKAAGKKAAAAKPAARKAAGKGTAAGRKSAAKKAARKAAGKKTGGRTAGKTAARKTAAKKKAARKVAKKKIIRRGSVAKSGARRSSTRAKAGKRARRR